MSTVNDMPAGLPAGPGTRRGLGSVHKVLQVLEALAERPQPVGVSELARALRAPRASVHQRLVTLLDAGWVVQDPDTKYRLSVHLAVIGEAALEHAQLGSLIQGSMEALAARTREAASLAVIDGSEAVIVQRVESSETLRADLRVGTRMPLHCSASGLVLLAFVSDEERAQCERAGVPMPSATVLDIVRSDGAAVVMDEFRKGISAAAAPIFGPLGRVEAALSLAAPTTRFDAGQALADVRAAANEVNAALGRTERATGR